MRVSVKIMILLVGMMIFTFPVWSAQSDGGLDEGNSMFEGSHEVDGRADVKSQEEINKENIKALKAAKKANLESRLVNTASKILGYDPDNLVALNGLAVFHFGQGELGLSKMIFERALKSHPNEPALHNNIGVVYLKEGDQRTAIKFFKKCLELDPDHSTGAANLASIYLKYKDYNRARFLLESGYKAIQKGLGEGKEEAIGVANNLAVAMSAQNQEKKARDIYEKILSGKTRNIVVLLNYAILLVERLKVKEEALRVISKVKFIADNPKVIKFVEQLEQKANSLK